MLQQTQARRVVEPYRRWVARFPDPPSCARAGPAEALRAWEGLGYNRRALNLHRAAVEITDAHGGVVPNDRVTLESLPGVGPYTARAVMVFAFEAPVGVVDTNVARVLSRVRGRRLGPRDVQELADSLVPPGESWAYNQTLFDIGVLHCRPRTPGCSGCPLRGRCVFARSGPAASDPGAPVRRQTRFHGSDRQGRGRLVAALRDGPVESAELAAAAGWPDDPARAAMVAGGLIHDGLAEWEGDRLRLP